MGSERLYSDLAWLWPVLSPPEEYIEEANFFAELIKSYSKSRPRTLLHLGCGGGHLDMTLKNHFAVTGVDKSAEMLDLAGRLNPDVQYIQADMRTFRSDERYDVALIYDSVNYMLDESDLGAVFKTAFESINESGIMVTYIEQAPEWFQQNKVKSNSRQKGGIELTYIEHQYDPDMSDTTLESTFIYLIRESGELRVEYDRHLCGIFPPETWQKLIEMAGFNIQNDTFKHSTFSPGEEYPILIGTKG